MRLSQRLKFWLVGRLGSLIVRLLIATLRVKVIGSKLPERIDGRAFVLCFWHSQLLAFSYLYRNMDIHVLASSHRDGEYIVRVTQYLGYGAVRGSSTRGGVRLLGEALDALRRGIDIAVTPDGPRGPRQQFKPGAVFLARESGCPIVLGACVPEKAWRLKSWDRFIIPKPFSRAVLVVSEPIIVPPGLEDQAMEAKRAELEAALNELCEKAQREARTQGERRREDRKTE